MPENPLLPHRKLRELHALMLAVRGLEDKRARRRIGRRHTVGREALLAATTMQLQPGDVLCPEPDDEVAAGLAAPTRTAAGMPVLAARAFAVPQRLALAAALAQGLQAAATRELPTGLVLACATAGNREAGWAAALAAAQTAQSPLLLAVTDATGGRLARATGRPPALLWSTASPVARRLKLPILTVDGEDAVAIYRVMQESIIRARFGGGPAILWAVVPPRAQPRAQQPLARLEQYLKVRGIALKS